ncbi:MAG TPA: hypothetical protein EYN67_12400 [Flavobacteriales bacterium]|nr:hypothetical protein [Methylococcaceae bacterium]HHZ96323.1 hypothetical protein [Flavobacteriales bacterium]
MKVLSIIWIYLLICGLTLGLAHNHHHERCGTKGYPSNSDVIAAVFLPVAISFVVTYDDKYYAKPECKGEVK